MTRLSPKQSKPCKPDLSTQSSHQRAAQDSTELYDQFAKFSNSEIHLLVEESPKAPL
jgi:hypothetical protein